MYPEIAAIIACSAASSWLTYELVQRHFSAYFDELHQKFESLEDTVKKYAAALESKAQQRQEELKAILPTHIEAKVKAAVSTKLGALDSEVCSFCKRLVAKFERTGDQIKCENCKNEGR
jgi:Skp family chaperone for outer membrane proteins